jgi:hypothetical protein
MGGKAARARRYDDVVQDVFPFQPKPDAYGRLGIQLAGVWRHLAPTRATSPSRFVVRHNVSAGRPMNLDTSTPRKSDAVIISLAEQRQNRACTQEARRITTRLLRELRIPGYASALVPWLTDDPHCHTNEDALYQWVRHELLDQELASVVDETAIRAGLGERLHHLLCIVGPESC